MIIRTVLDCRSKNLKFYTSIYLLVASWVAAMNGKSRLEVIHVGELPKTLKHFFERHGVAYRLAQPDPELAFVPTGNTLLGATSASDTDRILLVDNDVVFLKDCAALQNVQEGKLAGAIAGVIRVTEKQWDIIENELGLPTIAGGQTVDLSRVLQICDPSEKLIHFPRTYINGGVLLLPNDHHFVEVWRRHILLINAHFEGTKLASEAVCRSNMAGLATAAADHGKFEWLDANYNYRDFHFLLNALPIEAISILHMTGDARPQIPMPTKFRVAGYLRRIWRNRVLRPVIGDASLQPPLRADSYISDYVQIFWQNRILEPLSVMEPHLDPIDFGSAHATALAVLDRLEGLVQEYNLDEIMRDTITEVSA